MSSLLDRIGRWLEAQPKGLTQFGAFLCIIVLGVLDFLSGPQVAFSVFYLLPLAVLAVKGGRAVAIAGCLLSSVIWLFADVLAGAEFDATWIPAWNTLTRLGMFLIVTALVSTLHLAYGAQLTLALSDPLTGVANSRGFEARAAEIIETCRKDRVPLTAIYLDLDDFKSINDTLGHHGGDEVLRATGLALESHTRATDLVARLGGDEFAVLSPATGTDGAKALLEDLMERMARELEHLPSRVTFSTGAVTFLTMPEDLDEMIARSDKLMYQAKAEGKATYRHDTVIEGLDSVPDETPSRAPLAR